jgi:hypothetical protein
VSICGPLFLRQRTWQQTLITSELCQKATLRTDAFPLLTGSVSVGHLRTETQLRFLQAHPCHQDIFWNPAVSSNCRRRTASPKENVLAVASLIAGRCLAIMVLIRPL